MTTNDGKTDASRPENSAAKDSTRDNAPALKKTTPRPAAKKPARTSATAKTPAATPSAAPAADDASAKPAGQPKAAAAAAKKAPARKPPAKRAPAKKAAPATATDAAPAAAAAKAPASKPASAAKTPAAKTAAAKPASVKATAAKKPTAKTTPAKPTPAKTTPAKTTAAKAAPKTAAATATPTKPASIAAPDNGADSADTAPKKTATPGTEAAAKPAEPAPATPGDSVLSVRGLGKSYGDLIAVENITLEVPAGSFYGIVGPNGAGKTTTLSMITGLLRPDSGEISVNGVDVWADPNRAKRSIGALPDRMRLFDRLTGAQLLYYSGTLRGLSAATTRERIADLATAFDLGDALNRLVSDYSVGMTKKVALAAAMIHSPRILILDEPFESVDPVSAGNVIEILQNYVEHGGTVVLSSHGMDFIQRVCDHVSIIVNGRVLAQGSVDEVRGSGTLEDRFVELAGGRKNAEGLQWLHNFSD
ncbi:ABC transporter ATP-binding protein [Mycetocola spongiae]|uniref:ABC transporter ATP-binding protein n=1 Tax=Mycetocola spongiae TaxID=2859226 RepID=UPI001CF14F81|nr:ABC transporter ATP-binding protein [Mycetocola spongiae]UCR89089.1 ABC transporter ATP-binding protein [Mycetocola spongiae]